MISFTGADWEFEDVALLFAVLGLLLTISAMMAIPWLQEHRYRRLLQKGLNSSRKRRHAGSRRRPRALGVVGVVGSLVAVVVGLFGIH